LPCSSDGSLSRSASSAMKGQDMEAAAAGFMRQTGFQRGGDPFRGMPVLASATRAPLWVGRRSDGRDKDGLTTSDRSDLQSEALPVRLRGASSRRSDGMGGGLHAICARPPRGRHGDRRCQDAGSLPTSARPRFPRALRKQGLLPDGG
jgi:hypothetical protein